MDGRCGKVFRRWIEKQSQHIRCGSLRSSLFLSQALSFVGGHEQYATYFSMSSISDVWKMKQMDFEISPLRLTIKQMLAHRVCNALLFVLVLCLTLSPSLISHSLLHIRLHNTITLNNRPVANRRALLPIHQFISSFWALSHLFSLSLFLYRWAKAWLNGTRFSLRLQIKYI